MRSTTVMQNMQLLRDRNLNIALLVSTLWHLMIIMSVSPVLGSSDFKKNTTVISFLGSILGKVVVIPERPFGLNGFSMIEKIERTERVKIMNFGLEPPEFPSSSDSINVEKENAAIRIDRQEIRGLDMRHLEKTKMSFKFLDTLIKGEARNRLLLYRPELSMPVFYNSGFTTNYEVIVKFMVSKEGFVVRPECIKSSGWPQADYTAIRYVRSWQFAPLPETVENSQEGVVKITFNSRL